MLSLFLLKFLLVTSQLCPVADGYCATSINTAVFRQNSITSFDSLQYISFYDPEGNVVLGKRLIDSNEWQLTTTPFKGNVEDAHNVISIGVDGNNVLHLAFDHHGNPLKYTKAVSSGSLEMEPLQTMTGENEEKVTYPEFHSLPDGDLIFVYRSGSSGNGNMVMKRFDHKNNKWYTIHDNLIDGQDQRNAYWQMFVDSKGVIHLSWVWRETWMVETNHDMNYARSKDGGITWEKSDGTLYSIPITIDSSEIAWKIPQNSELINQTGMTTDEMGNPYIATYWRDADSEIPQYRIIWNDGTDWKMSQVGERTQSFSLAGGGTKMIPISRPKVVSDGEKAYLIFRDEERGSVVSLATTDDISQGIWQIIDLTDFSVDAWEPSFDSNLWKNAKSLHIFVQPSHQGDGEKLSSNPEISTPVSVLEYVPNN